MAPHVFTLRWLCNHGMLTGFFRFALMEHILDNPIWSALTLNNAELAFGDEKVKFFDKEVSPFVAVKENNAESFDHLHHLLLHAGPVIFASTEKPNLSSNWIILQSIEGFQMVHNGSTQSTAEINPVLLNKTHIPEMLALTQLTKPGPFNARTIEFDHYYGVFENGELAAMTGQRLCVENYAELSAVCTHPSHLGKGYARHLLLFHIKRLLGEGKIPYLHVRYDNERAINLYKGVDFEVRKDIAFYVLKKNEAIAL